MLYIVAQGEHVPGIAHDHGFADYHSIWDHPRNASLKRLRKDPILLLPGDELFIPDRDEKSVLCNSGQSHTFKLRRTTTRLRIQLNGVDGKPLASRECVLEIEGASQTLTTDAGGMLEADLPPTAQGGKLTIDGFEVGLQIGVLDPIEARTGVQGRLANLGYYTGTIGDPDDAQTRFAIQLFQVDNGLQVTGQADDATLDKLRSIHGC